MYVLKWLKLLLGIPVGAVETIHISQAAIGAAVNVLRHKPLQI